MWKGHWKQQTAAENQHKKEIDHSRTVSVRPYVRIPPHDLSSASSSYSLMQKTIVCVFDFVIVAQQRTNSNDLEGKILKKKEKNGLNDIRRFE